jgi:hypothetical protein
MKWKIISVFIFCVLICPLVASADYDAYTYMIDAGTRRTIEWNPAPGADGYEIVVRRMKSGKALYSGTVTDTSITIKFNTIGLNVIYLRAFRGTGETREYGEWINTLDPSFAVVNSVPKAWVMAIQNYY